MNELDALRQRIAEMEREMTRLRAASGFSFLSPSVTRSDSKGAGMTIIGIEEMVLLVDRNDRLSYVNGPMGNLLAMNDRRAAIGSPLAQWDHIPGADRILSSLVTMARNGEEAITIEPPVHQFPVERLPDPGARRPAGPVYLRATAFPTGDKVQVTIQETTRLKWLEKTFSRYLPSKIIEQLQGMSHEDLMRPQRATLTMLFADLRDFTTLSERLDPGALSELLSSFLGEMAAEVSRFDGTVAQFVGDELFAIFGAPQRQPDHALRALVTAVHMKERHEAWRRTREGRGLSAPLAGIGVATGEVVVGNIGTLERSEYTAVGYAVNLASRLCEQAPGGTILTTVETCEEASRTLAAGNILFPAPRLKFDQKGEMILKNVSSPVKALYVRVDDSL